MPNIKSAKKRVLVTKKKTAVNTIQKSALKTYVKKAKVSVSNNNDDAAERVKAASIKLDKAAAKGIIHKNTAARRKSRLAKSLNAVAAKAAE